MQSTEPILSLSNVEASYGPVQAIRGVSLQVPQGSIVTVLGSNGAGKTTILKTISGILDPRKGTIQFLGQSIQGLQPDAIVRLGLSHVPEGREVFPLLSVRENLLMGAYGRNDLTEIQTDIERWFDIFPRLKERESQLAGTLSGGEQQMLAMARALMSRPRLLLLDEPSMGLAPIMVERIFEVVSTVARQGVTILLVEQNVQQALSIASRGYVMESGCITLHDSAAKLLQDPRVKEAYLGH